MSKKKKSKSRSAPLPPPFSPSAIMYGDQVISRTYKDPAMGIVTQYIASPEEQERRQIANERINQILQTLGAPAPEIAQQWDQMRDDYVNQQTDNFTREYNKALNTLREDVASRFGTLKATPYFDKMTEMEREVRAPALLDIQRAGSMYRTDLYNQDQTRKLQELSALGYNLSADQQAFINNLRTPLESSQLMNQFNQNRYMQQLQAYQNDLINRRERTNSFLNFLGRAF